jgi:hypothetical protein
VARGGDGRHGQTAFAAMDGSPVIKIVQVSDKAWSG